MNRLIPAALGFILCTPLFAGTAGEIFGSVVHPDSRRIANAVDLQIQKDLSLRPIRLSLIGTVYNVLDTET